MKVSEKYLDCNGLRIFYRQTGHGPPLVLFHGGWATGKLNWSAHYHELSQHFTVISPDHRGHGNTENPDGEFSSYGQLAWDMIGFVEHLNLKTRPLLMGHSSGALIALHMSIFQPDVMARQVLIGIHPFIGESDRFKRGMEEFFHTDSYLVPPKKWQYIMHHPVNSLALWSAHRQTPWFELLQTAWPMWIKPLAIEKSDYCKVAVPTLVVIGEMDEFGLVEEARELAGRIDNSSFEAVAGENHMLVINSPNKLQKLAIPFLLGR